MKLPWFSFEPQKPDGRHECLTCHGEHLRGKLLDQEHSSKHEVNQEQRDAYIADGYFRLLRDHFQVGLTSAFRRPSFPKVPHLRIVIRAVDDGHG